MTVHELSRADARRIAVRAQLLDSMRPAGLLDVVRHLTLLQIDPTAARTHHRGRADPLAQNTGMGVLPWSQLKSGLLSGAYTRNRAAPAGVKRGGAFGISPTEAQFAVIDAVTTIAGQIGATPAAVALAWVKNRPGVTSTLIGPGRLDHLEANLAALDLTLTGDQRAALDDVSALSLNFPAALNRDIAPMLQYAGATVKRPGHFGLSPAAAEPGEVLISARPRGRRRARHPLPWGIGVLDRAEG